MQTFSPVSSLNSSQTDKHIPVKTSQPNFVTFFVCFGNSLFDYLWIFFVCYGSKPGSHLACNLGKFGIARSEELEVNQWIMEDIPRLSSKWKRAKNTIHHFSIYWRKLFRSQRLWFHLNLQPLWITCSSFCIILHIKQLHSISWTDNLWHLNDWCEWFNLSFFEIWSAVAGYDEELAEGL